MQHAQTQDDVNAPAQKHAGEDEAGNAPAKPAPAPRPITDWAGI